MKDEKIKSLQSSKKKTKVYDYLWMAAVRRSQRECAEINCNYIEERQMDNIPKNTKHGKWKTFITSRKKTNI